MLKKALKFSMEVNRNNQYLGKAFDETKERLKEDKAFDRNENVFERS